MPIDVLVVSERYVEEWGGVVNTVIHAALSEGREVFPQATTLTRSAAWRSVRFVTRRAASRHAAKREATRPFGSPTRSILLRSCSAPGGTGEHTARLTDPAAHDHAPET
jgi:hypothetical protein